MAATLSIKPTGITGKTQFAFKIDLEAQVGHAKEQIAKELGLENAGVRLVCAGKILSDNEATLKSCGVTDGSSVFAVKEATKKTESSVASTPTAAAAPAGGAAGYNANPMMQPPMPGATGGMDPMAAMMQQMMAGGMQNGGGGSPSDANPMAAMMANPMMQQMLAGGMQNGAIPGFGAQQDPNVMPALQAMQQALQGNTDIQEMQKLQRIMERIEQQRKQAGSTEPVTVETLKAEWARQLEELKDMGFEDENACLRALVKHDGDAQHAAVTLGEDMDKAAAKAAVEAVGTVSYESEEVVAHVYDMSGGMAQTTSQMLIGKYMELLPHTGIVVFGKEYHFSKGPEITAPGRALPSPVKKTFKLGRTTKTAAELEAFLNTVKADYSAEKYNLLSLNGNHYADAISKFLLDGKGIPAELNSLIEELNTTPQGQMMAQTLQQLQGNHGAGMFSPTGAFFHGGTQEDSTGMRGMFANAAQQFQQEGGGAPPPGVQAHVHWQVQLAQMAAMGLVDEAMNIRALNQANGNVEVAVNNVFNMAGQ